MSGELLPATDALLRTAQPSVASLREVGASRCGLQVDALVGVPVHARNQWIFRLWSLCLTRSADVLSTGLSIFHLAYIRGADQ